MEILLNSNKDVLNKVESVLLKKKYSKNTTASYKTAISNFLGYINKDIGEITTADVIKFLDSTKGKSLSYLNVHNSALDFFHTNFITHKEKPIKKRKYVSHIKKHQNPERLDLSMYIDKEDIKKILAAAPNLKYKALFSIIIDSKMCVDEIVSLRIGDMVRNNRSIYFKDKGYKEGYVSVPTKQIVKEYYTHIRQTTYKKDIIYAKTCELWLFPHKDDKKVHVSKEAVMKQLRNSIEKAGVVNKYDLSVLDNI